MRGVASVSNEAVELRRRGQSLAAFTAKRGNDEWRIGFTADKVDMGSILRMEWKSVGDRLRESCATLRFHVSTAPETDGLNSTPRLLNLGKS